MAYIKPSVRVFQEFQNVSPAIATPDLDALIIGPCYQFLDPQDPSDTSLSDSGETYTGQPLNSLAYPNQDLGSDIDTSRVSVHLKNPKLLMYATPDSNSATITSANPELIVSSTENFGTLKGRGVLPGDQVRLKLDSVVGTQASLTNQGVTLTATAKGTPGNSIGITLVDPSAASQTLSASVVGSTITVTLGTDGGSAITTDADALVAFLTSDVAVSALVSASGSGSSPLAAISTTLLSGGVDKVDGDVFETTVVKVKTTNSTKDTLVLSDSAPANHQVAGLDLEIVISPSEDIVLAPSSVTVTEDDVSINPGLTSILSEVESTPGTPLAMDIVSGNVHIYYYALRQDVTSEIIDVQGVGDIEGLLGKISPKNPLAYAALKASQNTVNRVRLLGVSSDDQTGFQGALDIASAVDTVYALVPLTQDPVVHAAFKSHVEQFSTPEEGKWRICFINQALDTTKPLTSTTVMPQATVSDNGTGFFVRVNDSSAEFMSTGVTAKDVFTINGEDFLVEEVINNNTLLLEAGTGPSSAVAVDTDYSIVRNMSKTQQAKEIGAKASSFGSRRAFYVWPDLVGDGGTTVEGYYLCAAIAGMVSGLPPHKGFTNIGVVGFDDVGRSNRYFSEPMLDIMAEDGVYIVVQDAPGAIPYSRHQLSTDPDIVEFRELSITKNVDFVSYFFKRRLRTFIGEWNITPNVLLAIQQFTQGLLDFLLTQSVEKIGTPIVEGSITSLAQNESLSDHVDLYLDIQVPYPLNNLNVHLLI